MTFMKFINQELEASFLLLDVKEFIHLIDLYYFVTLFIRKLLYELI